MPDDPNAPSAPSGPPPYPGAPPRAPDPWYTPAPSPGAPPPPTYPSGSYYPPGGMPPPGHPPQDWMSDLGPNFGPPGAYAGGVPFAGFWIRVGGFLLDIVILGVVSLVFVLPTHTIHRTEMVTVNGHSTLHLGVSTGATLFLLVLGALYSGLLIGLRGQTLGMMAVRIKAVDANTGGLIGFWRALGRDLFERLLGALFFIPVIIDLLFPAWDPRKQTLHDKVTNTVVVKV